MLPPFPPFLELSFRLFHITPLLCHLDDVPTYKTAPRSCRPGVIGLCSTGYGFRIYSESGEHAPPLRTSQGVPSNTVENRQRQQPSPLRRRQATSRSPPEILGSALNFYIRGEVLSAMVEKITTKFTGDKPPVHFVRLHYTSLRFGVPCNDLLSVVASSLCLSKERTCRKYVDNSCPAACALREKYIFKSSEQRTGGKDVANVPFLLGEPAGLPPVNLPCPGLRPLLIGFNRFRAG